MNLPSKTIFWLSLGTLALGAGCRRTTGDIVFDDTGREVALNSRLPDCERDPCVSWELGGYASSVTPDGAGGAWLVVSRGAGDYEIAGCSEVDLTPSIYYNSGWLLHLDAAGACQHLEAIGHAGGRLWRLADGRLLLQGDYFPDVRIGDQTFTTSPGVAGRYRAVRGPDGTWEWVEARREGPLAEVSAFAAGDEDQLLGIGTANAGDRLLGVEVPEAGAFVYQVDVAARTVDFQTINYRGGNGIWRTERGGTQLLATPPPGALGAANVVRLDGASPWSAEITASGYNSFSAFGAPTADGGFVGAFGIVNPFTPMPQDAHIGFVGAERHVFGFAWMGMAVAGLDADGAWAWSFPVAETLPWSVFEYGGRGWLISGGTDRPTQVCGVGAAGLTDCQAVSGSFVVGDAAGHLWSLNADGYANTGVLHRAGPAQ